MVPITMLITATHKAHSNHTDQFVNNRKTIQVTFIAGLNGSNVCICYHLKRYNSTNNRTMNRNVFRIVSSYNMLKIPVHLVHTGISFFFSVSVCLSLSMSLSPSPCLSLAPSVCVYVCVCVCAVSYTHLTLPTMAVV